MTNIIKTVALSAITLFLCSCASTSVVETWRNPAMQVHRLHKIMVVRLSKSIEDRRTYEDVLCGELNQRGVEAIPGHTKLTGAEKTNQKLLQTAVQQAGAEAVLMVQTTNIERQSSVQPGYGSAPFGMYPGGFPSWDMYGYYGSSSFYDPPTVYTYDLATIQINLFESKGGKLLWAATVESSEPGNPLSVSKDMAKMVIESLIKEGFI